MSKLSQGLRHLRFPKGHRVIRQGDVGGCAWLIEDGQMEVFAESATGIRSLAVIGRGAVVGEMALIDDGRRSASVWTVTEVSCVELDRAAFKNLIGKCQPLAGYLLESLVAAIRRAYGLPQEERIEGSTAIRSVNGFDRVLDRRLYPAGYTFFHQDDPGTSAFLIQDGRVSIQQTSDTGMRELAQLGPGRIFGELALLNSAPRRASAIALDRVVAEVIYKEKFDGVIASMPPILRALTKIYIQQLSGPMPR